MKNVKELQDLIDIETIEKENILLKIRELENERQFEIEYIKFFHNTSISLENIKISTGWDGDSIRFIYIPNNNELFTIYLDKSNYSLKENDKLKLSYYSSSCENEFEFSRLVLLGKLAEFLNDDENKDNLISLNNRIHAKNADEIKALYKKANYIQTDINDKKLQIENIVKKDSFKSFEEEGIQLEKSTVIDITLKSRLYDVIFMKLVEYTNKNKKTATVLFMDSSGRNTEWKQVKISNIEYLIK
jgi:hypothetical protein